MSEAPASAPNRNGPSPHISIRARGVDEAASWGRTHDRTWPHAWARPEKLLASCGASTHAH